MTAIALMFLFSFIGFCRNGIVGSDPLGYWAINICCSKSCGLCGKENQEDIQPCQLRPGGPMACCWQQIINSGKLCLNRYDTACASHPEINTKLRQGQISINLRYISK